MEEAPIETLPLRAIWKRVEVAVPPVVVEKARYGTFWLVVERPATERFAHGVVVPIPKRPAEAEMEKMLAELMVEAPE